MAKRRRANSEGSIYQRKNGTWEAKITLPDGKRKSFYTRTQGALLAKVQDVRKRMADGLPPSPDKVHLGTYLRRWLQDSVKPTVRPYTYQSYEMLVRRHIEPELAHIKLTRLTAQDIQKFLNRKRESGLSARTVQYIHAVLRRALGQAERWGMVQRNVARLVSPPRVPKADIHPLTLSDVKKLLEAVRSERLSALHTVSLAVGLRQGESLGLRWQDVSFETGTLSVKVSLQRLNKKPVLAELKTEKSRRTIKLPEVCVAALLAHREKQALERAFMGDAWQD